MLKINDLRVGNYILFKEYGEGDGHIGVMKRGDFGRFNDEEYHAIPLTPEWLERCGFTTDGSGDDNHSEPLWDHQKTRYKFSDGSFVHNGSAYDDWHDIGDVQYVHQLQNLFFALTGEELQIKS